MYKEVKIQFDEQDVILRPGEENDVVIIECREIDGQSFRLYLTHQEAEYLTNEIIKFIK